MSERATQLIFEIHKGQSQFAYFQLGVAASAIAFALHETSGVSLSDAPWPLGLAVALWGLSFAIGCFGIDARERGLLTNASFLQLTQFIPPVPLGSGIATTLEKMKVDVEKSLKRPWRRFRWQKWALFAGAIAYVGGHVMQMAATPSQSNSAAASKDPQRSHGFGQVKI